MKRFITLFLLFFSAASAASIHEVRTVYLTEPGYAGIDLYQKFYYGPGEKYAFVREHNLLLSLGRSAELGIQVPYANVREKQQAFDRLGDVKIHLNTATDWFSSFMVTNFYIEYNTGSGAAFTDLNTHPLEAYGYPEWRTGLIFFKRWLTFSLTGNIFYVFKGARPDGTREVNFIDGMTLNIFNKDAYNRAFGFNPQRSENFFYYKNLENDNLEYMIAVNTDLFHPFVPFIELTYSHDFTSDSEFIRRAPGAGIDRSQISIGSKFFLAENRFALKTALIIPVGDMTDMYSIGGSFGARIDF